MPAKSALKVDVAIVGAGMAGLACGRSLQASGYSVVLLEKSRGPGGRVATRRAHATRIDHGLPFFWDQGPLTRQLIDAAIAAGLLQPWPRERATYCHPNGNSEIGKFLARDLDVRLQHRVTKLTAIDKDLDRGKTASREPLWQLECDDLAEQFLAKAVAIAIPAPQIAELLRTADLGESTPEPTAVLAQLDAVIYDPCITVMAGYSPETPLPSWRALDFAGHSLLQWIGLDSSKRDAPVQPVFVIHSSPEFAERHLNAADLDAVAHKLLSHAAAAVPFRFTMPEWFQVHRWRYAVPKRFLHARCLRVSAPLPLVCAGEWALGNNIEAAIASGQAAARSLQESSLAG
ncbi:MAG: FAD-dependent oxidoreductase [Cyanobacteria bacterium J06641_5]